MLLQVPARVNRFVALYCGIAGWRRGLVAALVTAFLLVRGRRTLTNVGQFVESERRVASTISRFLADQSDLVVDGYNRAMQRAINRCVKRSRKSGRKRWVLIIDTTFQRKHALSTPNLIKYKDTTHGVPASSHGFVTALLLTPGGVRIPLPVLDFYSRDVVREINQALQELKISEVLRHRSQIDLCCDLVRLARKVLPADLELLVLVDNFFEGPKLDRTCRALSRTYYITPLDTGRVATVPGEEHQGKRKVRDIEKSLPDGEFDRVPLVDGKAPFEYLRRLEDRKRKPGRPRERVYQVAQRDLDLSGIGRRTVFFSWKKSRFYDDSTRAKAHLKMLVTNHPSLSAQEAIDGYSLRWQVELLFRELKSDLGLGHYQVLTIEAIRSHIHLVFTAHLMLEMYRLDLEKEDPAQAGCYRVPRARTRQMVSLLEAEVRDGELRQTYELGRRGMALPELRARKVAAPGAPPKRRRQPKPIVEARGWKQAAKRAARQQS